MVKVFNISKMDELSGLKTVVTFHRLTGITYFNSNINIQSKLKGALMFVVTVGLITIEITTMLYFLLFVRTGFDEFSNNKNRKTIMLKTLFNVALFTHFLDSIYAQYILLFRGKSIMTFLQVN